MGDRLGIRGAVYIFVSVTKLLLDGFTKPLPGGPKSPGSSVGRALGF